MTDKLLELFEIFIELVGAFILAYSVYLIYTGLLTINELSGVFLAIVTMVLTAHYIAENITEDEE